MKETARYHDKKDRFKRKGIFGKYTFERISLREQPLLLHFAESNFHGNTPNS